MSNTYPSMTGKVCLITGANSGIGKATALELARLGATVVMVCRDRDRGDAALRDVARKSGNKAVDLMLCDLASQQGIRQLDKDFRAKHQRLDVLINNAAVMLRQRSLSPDGCETTFAVNHLGYFLLTNLLLDLLVKSAPSRIVNVASAAQGTGRIDFDDLQAEKSFGGFAAYSNSKLANMLFTYELARRLSATGVTANALHPGVVASTIFRNDVHNRAFAFVAHA